MGRRTFNLPLLTSPKLKLVSIGSFREGKKEKNDSFQNIFGKN
jgi:hypothetical protein